MINETINDILQNKNFVMFFASIVFTCGIMACFYDMGIILGALFTLFFISMLYLRIFSIRKILVFIFIFYLGFFITYFKIKNYDELLSLAPAQVSITGRIVSCPKIDSNLKKIKFFLQTTTVDEDNIKEKTFVTITNDDKNLPEKLNIGDVISIKGNLRKPFKSTNPSQFDYSSYLKNYNVFTTLYSDSQDLKILNGDKNIKWKILKLLNQKRKDIIAVHARYIKTPNLQILGGIVFGDDAIPTPEEIKNSFINSGLLHILAASGMNVGFIFTFLFYILKFLKIPYKPRVMLGMFAVILYTFMTGLGPSVVRAALMLLFILAGKLIDRDTHSISLLSFVAVLMLLYNPAYINDVSFQLSFMVTFGLLLSVNTVASKIPKIPNWIKIPIIIPIIAQIWVAPIQMFYFNTFSLYSIFANISTVSIVSIISFGGFLSSLLAIVSIFADTICKLLDFGLDYLLNILINFSNYFAGLKYCLVQTTHPNIFQILLYYAMISSVSILTRYDKYKQAFITFLSVSILLAVTTISPISKDLEIIAFDVQNADSFLVKTPENKYFIIDTGKAPYDSGNSQAKIIMLKYLKDRGIKNLEGVIVTHFDNDHSGGTVDIITNTKTKKLYLNSYSVETQTAKNIFSTIKTSKQNYEIVHNNSEIYSEKDLNLKVFKADIKGADESNGNSIITLLKYKNFEMLFMGDAGTEAFNQVKSNIPHNIEILKVGHHGGPKVVNSDMLNHIGNKISIISTGINYFGHPNKGTLDLLRNTEIYRTDILNSIKISSNGDVYSLFSYNPNSKKYEVKKEYKTY